MAVTFNANTHAGSQLRRLAKALEIQAGNMPDNPSTGAATVLTVDNAPSSGTVSVQITAGPYATSAATIV